jgi:hypothetical protein
MDQLNGRDGITIQGLLYLVAIMIGVISTPCSILLSMGYDLIAESSRHVPKLCWECILRLYILHNTSIA